MTIVGRVIFWVILIIMKIDLFISVNFHLKFNLIFIINYLSFNFIIIEVKIKFIINNREYYTNTNFFNKRIIMNL